jgi:hypothetical protein
MERNFILMRLILVMIVLAAVGLSGCNPDSNNSNANGNANANRTDFKPPPPIKPTGVVDPNFKPCNPYFPLVPGSVAKYVINYSSGIVGDLTVIVDAADEDGQKVFTQRSQLIDRSGGTQITQSIVRKFVCDGGTVRILSEKTESNIAGQQSSVDFDYRENSMMMTDPQSLSRKGTTWTYAFRTVFHNPGQPPSRSDVPTVVAFEVAGPEDVTTATGNVKAIKVIRKINESGTTDFYAAGLGLVKRQSTEGTNWELKEYSGLKAQD